MPKYRYQVSYYLTEVQVEDDVEADSVKEAREMMLSDLRARLDTVRSADANWAYGVTEVKRVGRAKKAA